MNIIYGPKGSGKTKAIIESATKALETAKGHVVFITNTNRYTFDLNYQIRFINTEDFNVTGIDGFSGFIKGIVAASGDNEYIYIDGIARITDTPLSELGSIFEAMEKLEADYGVKFVLTVSAAKEDLPEFVAKFVK